MPSAGDLLIHQLHEPVEESHPIPVSYQNHFFPSFDDPPQTPISSFSCLVLILPIK